ncbi:MAG: hypothetical protein M3340_05690 [Actinomycetota bacterium]|nr:hypothetical protein [Actinomycetota bacterium]
MGLAAFALINILTGLFAVVDPQGFYDSVGPFGAYNDHYIRDAAGAMQGSLGVAMAIAVFRRSWRVGVLGYALLHFAFHAVNHLVDIGDADPESVGVVDFVSLALGALVLGWLFTRAVREERTA